MAHGLPAGIAALIAGLQPLGTAALAGPMLGERVSGLRWAGIGAGFAGVVLVLGPRLTGAGAYGPAVLLAAFASLAAITAGTLWQKRTGGALDLRVGTAIQFGAATVATGLAALSLEDGRIDPAPAFWFGLAWAVGILSIGGIALLLLLLRRGAVVGVSALMFLVPPISALLAWALFGDALSAVQIAGMALAVAGVAIASRG